MTTIVAIPEPPVDLDTLLAAIIEPVATAAEALGSKDLPDALPETVAELADKAVQRLRALLHDVAGPATDRIGEAIDAVVDIGAPAALLVLRKKDPPHTAAHRCIRAGLLGPARGVPRH